MKRLLLLVTLMLGCRGTANDLVESHWVQEKAVGAELASYSKDNGACSAKRYTDDSVSAVYQDHSAKVDKFGDVVSENICMSILIIRGRIQKEKCSRVTQHPTGDEIRQGDVFEKFCMKNFRELPSNITEKFAPFYRF